MLVSNDNVTETTPQNRMLMQDLEIKNLSFSPLNPTVRTKNSQLRKLKNNLAENGQLTPVIVKKIKSSQTTGSGHTVLRLVDGHRRATCLRELGFKTIKAIVIDNQANYDETFTALHADTMKISSVQECERWLKGAKSISTQVLNVINKVESKLGKRSARQVITRCVQMNMSPTTLIKCMEKYSTYTKRTSRAENKKVTYWLLNIAKPWKLYSAIDAFIPLALLLDCVDNKKTIPADWAISHSR